LFHAVDILLFTPLINILPPVLTVDNCVEEDSVKSVHVEPLSIEYDIDILDGFPPLLKLIVLLSSKDSIVK
jgi:hypothetical protein